MCASWMLDFAIGTKPESPPAAEGRKKSDLLPILARASPRKDIENWYASQNHEAAQRRIAQVVGKGVVEEQG